MDEHDDRKRPLTLRQVDIQHLGLGIGGVFYACKAALFRRGVSALYIVDRLAVFAVERPFAALVGLEKLGHGRFALKGQGRDHAVGVYGVLALAAEVAHEGVVLDDGVCAVLAQLQLPLDCEGAAHRGFRKAVAARGQGRSRRRRLRRGLCAWLRRFAAAGGKAQQQTERKEQGRYTLRHLFPSPKTASKKALTWFRFSSVKNALSSWSAPSSG